MSDFKINCPTTAVDNLVEQLAVCGNVEVLGIPAEPVLVDWTKDVFEASALRELLSKNSRAPPVPDTSISGRRVARELTELIAHRGAAA